MADLVRWGVLGAAGIARIALISALHAARNARLVAVASRDPARAERDLAGLDVPRVAPSYDALIDDPAIDAV
jgi:predicted dehydrogenase